MSSTRIFGRLIKDLSGLQSALRVNGFQVEQVFSDANGGQPYVCVCLAETDLKDPMAVVQGFVDNPPEGSASVVKSPDGSKWLVCVGNDGSLKTVKQPPLRFG
jgi:hypothetical protein